MQDTSLTAYEREVKSTLGARHNDVLRALEALKNATNTELAEYLGWSINRVTPRIFELVNRKIPLVMDAGKRMCKKTGRNVHAWSLVSAPTNVYKPYTFHSKSGGSLYQVTDRGDGIDCTCLGFKYRGDCRHVQEVKTSKEQATLFA